MEPFEKSLTISECYLCCNGDANSIVEVLNLIKECQV